MQGIYLTVKKQVETHFVEKKSKFIAYVKPIKLKEEAIDFISEIKSKHWDASHNVYAYHITGDSAYQKYSDDGEPTGTAGLPVLNAITMKNLTNTIVVVTRYFGGTLLGTGGLVRAYGKSASLGIEAAKIVKIIFCNEYNIFFPYTIVSKAERFLNDKEYRIKNIEYTQEVKYNIYIPKDKEDKFFYELSNLTNGDYRREFIEENYYEFN